MRTPILAELMNTHVDPVILKRTIKQSIRHAHPPGRGGAGRYPPSGMDSHRMDRMEHRMDRRRPVRFLLMAFSVFQILDVLNLSCNKP